MPQKDRCQDFLDGTKGDRIEEAHTTANGLVETKPVDRVDYDAVKRAWKLVNDEP
jgi:hypothetical protein